MARGRCSINGDSELEGGHAFGLPRTARCPPPPPSTATSSGEVFPVKFPKCSVPLLPPHTQRKPPAGPVPLQFPHPRVRSWQLVTRGPAPPPPSQRLQGCPLGHCLRHLAPSSLEAQRWEFGREAASAPDPQTPPLPLLTPCPEFLTPPSDLQRVPNPQALAASLSALRIPLRFLSL